MIRGTTPTHTFQIPLEASMVKDVRISYAQGGVVLAEKTKNDCTLSGNEIKTKLTQEDTLKFRESKPIEVQLRVLTTDGDVMATNIYTLSACKALNEEVLV